MDDNKITYFATTNSRNKQIPFGIKRKDRARHTYVIGKTGMGKSTLLENMAIQDIQGGEGCAFVDPHGKTADLLLDFVPESRIKDVLYFAPFDMEHPVSFNVMEDVGHDKRHLVANGLMSAFKKIWVDAWSARMEYILNNILLALLEYPDATLIGVNRMLADKDYRSLVVDNITDPSVKAFWLQEFARYGDRYMQEAGAAIQNKIGQFIANPLVRNIIGQPRSSFDIREMMDSRKIMIINLSKGRVGEANANLLGSMMITKIYLAAMSRADVSEGTLRGLPNFYLYVDEFQSFANESFADILSEARKYKLNLTLAHQYVEQMSEEVRAAVFGNVGTMVAFRVGAFDAELLEKEMSPQFTAEDLVNLGFAQIYLRLMIDGVASPPFSATTLPPIPLPQVSFREAIIESSRAIFAERREKVEEDIREWHRPVKDAAPRAPVDIPRADSRPPSREGFRPREGGERAQNPRGEGTRPSAPFRTEVPGGRSERPYSSRQPARPNVTAPSTGAVRGERPVSAAPTSVQASSPLQHRVPAAPSSLAPHVAPPIAEKARAEARPWQSRPLRDGARERGDTREAELRKAISLDYLRPRGEKDKAKERTPTNVAALRNALHEVLKSSPGAPIAPMAVPAPESAPAVARPAIHDAPVNSHDEHSRHTSREASEVETSTPPKEVSEDVLRRVLDIGDAPK